MHLVEPFLRLCSLLVAKPIYTKGVLGGSGSAGRKIEAHGKNSKEKAPCRCRRDAFNCS